MPFKRVVSSVLGRRRPSGHEVARDVEAVDFEEEISRYLVVLQEAGLDRADASTYALRWQSGVTPVDLTHFRSLCNVDASRSSELEREKLLSSLFSSGDKLYLSLVLHCQQSTEGKENGDINSSQGNEACLSSRVSLEQVSRDWDVIFQDAKVMSTSTATLRRLLSTQLPDSLQFSSSTASACILASLLLLPHAQEVSLYPNFLEPLLTLFEAHRDRIREPLLAALSRCPPPTRAAAVFAVQQFLTIRLYSRSSLDGPSVAAVQTLATLHEANTRSPHPCPSSIFHNDVVNSADFNLQRDWLRSRQQQPHLFSFARFPFLYNPAAKARLLRCHAAMEMREGMAASLLSPSAPGPQGELLGLLGLGGRGSPSLNLTVRRGPHLLQDTLSQIRGHLAQERGRLKALRRPLRVQFVGEQGVDEGGISREFFQIIVRECFSPNYGMFCCDATSHTFWIRASAIQQMLDEFELIGVIVGLAIHNGHNLSLSLARALYKKLLGAPTSLEDVREIHPDVHNTLLNILAYPADQLEADMGLTFQVSHELDFETVTHDLVEGAADIPVTGANRADFVAKYVQFLTVGRVAPQFDAFERGFSHVCDRTLMEMFRACPGELEEVVCGSQTLDFEELRRTAVYEGGIDGGSDVVRWLWEILGEYSEEQKRNFLQFVTGADRAPVGGLGALSPRLKVHKNGGSSVRLPTAHVCFNILLLPVYDQKEVLAERLAKAIENSFGFGLM